MAKMRFTFPSGNHLSKEDNNIQPWFRRVDIPLREAHLYGDVYEEENRGKISSYNSALFPNTRALPAHYSGYCMPLQVCKTKS